MILTRAVMQGSDRHRWHMATHVPGICIGFHWFHWFHESIHQEVGRWCKMYVFQTYIFQTALGISKDVAPETAATCSIDREAEPGLLQIEGQTCSALASDFDWILSKSLEFWHILIHILDADVAGCGRFCSKCPPVCREWNMEWKE